MCQFCAGGDYSSLHAGLDSGIAPPPQFFRLKSKKSTSTQPSITSTPTNSSASKITAADLDTLQFTMLSSASIFIKPHEKDFLSSIARWSLSGVRKPAVVIKPGSVEDISKVVAFAAEKEFDLKICGGGFSPGGMSSSDGGIVVDMENFSSVSLESEGRIVVGGGAIWKDVDKVCAEHGIVVPGPLISQLGVGGSTLAGGYGWLLGEYGISLDSLIEAEIVTGEGKIYTSSEEKNPELFWLLRGAGNRVGVVTKFIFKSYPMAEDIWYSQLIFPAEQLEALAHAVNEWMAKKDLKASATLTFTLPAASAPATVTLTCFYNGPSDLALSVFASFMALSPITNITSRRPYWELNTLTSYPPTGSGTYNRIVSANLHPDLSPRKLRRAHTHFLSLLTPSRFTHPSATSCTILLAQPNGIQRLPRSATAFPWRDGYFEVLILVAWTQPTEEPVVVTWQDEMKKILLEAGDPFRAFAGNNDYRGPVGNEFGIGLGKVRQGKENFDKKNVFLKV